MPPVGKRHQKFKFFNAELLVITSLLLWGRNVTLYLQAGLCLIPVTFAGDTENINIQPKLRS